ncbi:cytochrome P450 2J2-like [Patiria miniata]|uniref:Carbamoyl phosphate synthase ATP-binding domain-containing protein n=1 Tax=Patiria miniata TaxID=46514 RepID=A0A913ZL64_PATMI|nr:cytochrome P450 2J2-like [Patiria miniata]
MAVVHNLIANIGDDVTVLCSALLYALSLFAASWLYLRWRAWARDLPPAPSFFMSHWLLLKAVLTKRTASHLFFSDIAKKYGPVYGIWIGHLFVTVATDVELCKEALLRNHESFPNRRNIGVLAKLFETEGGIVSEIGPAWKERRRFGVSAMRLFGAGKRSLEPKINGEANYLVQSFADYSGKPFDPSPLVLNAVSNIIAQISLGRRFEYTDPVFQEILGLMKDVSEVAVLDPGNVFPFLVDSFLYNDKRSKFRRLKDFIECNVRSHRETHDVNNPRDLIDMYLREIEKEGGQGKEESPMNGKAIFTESNIWRFIHDLFLAGTETTSFSLLWIILIVTLHPEIQEKVQEEIDDVIGRSRQPTTSDLLSMPYTRATISEVLRHRPVLPIYQRETPLDRQGTFGQYTVPRNSYFLLNVHGIHHDPELFPDPDAVRPERFLSIDENGQRTYSGKGLPLLNFGLGKRACVGESMARAEIFLFFVNLLQRFTFTIPPNDVTPDLEGVPGRIWSTPTFRLCVHTR